MVEQELDSGFLVHFSDALTHSMTTQELREVPEVDLFTRERKGLNENKAQKWREKVAEIPPWLTVPTPSTQPGLLPGVLSVEHVH